MNPEEHWIADEAEIEAPRALGAVVRGLGVHCSMSTFVSVSPGGEQWIEVGDADSGYIRRGDLSVYAVLHPGIEVQS